MFGLPLWFVAIVLAFLGCIMGSFLDVFISRFHTGRSINGRSRCTSCGRTLTWYELFPLFSYAALRGRCRVCGSAIPIRLFIMEVVTGLLFMLVWFSATTPSDLVLGVVFVMLAIAITVYDLKHFIIPNAFVLAMFLLAGVRLIIELGLNDLSQYGLFVASGLLAASFYGSLWLLSKGRWIGLGDAKLALPLGMMLTVEETFSFVVLSFWVGALVSICLLLLQWLFKRGQFNLRFFDAPLTIKSEVPFAPFLLTAFSLVHFFGVNVLDFFFQLP